MSRTLGAVMVAALGAVSLVACTDEPGDPSGISDEPDEGGTVRVLSVQPEFESLDPQRIYVTNEANASKLLTRTLTTFAAKPGVDGTELVGDLATDTGTPNKDNTVWEFTLRDGLKWETGDAVTCEDVRYGVLRNFDVRSKDPVVTGGPAYPRQWLDVDEDYQGPRVDGTGDVGGVTCVDDATVRFELAVPASDFPAAVAMTAFSPVPEKSDTWADYSTEPLSTGPYKLTRYKPAEGDTAGSAVFERNKHWDPASDKVRGAKPDKIVWEFGIDAEYAAQQIIADNPEYANAIMYESLPANYVQQVINNKALSEQTVGGSTATTRYMSINTETVEELDCRRALVYGFNKRKFLDVYGGEVFGDYATTMLAPDDPGHKDFDVYGVANNPDGDLEKAQELLDETDDCPSELTLGVADTKLTMDVAETVVTTYARLGITVKIKEIDAANYFNTLSDPENVRDLTIGGWAPDWPGGSGVIPALFDGDGIQDGTNSNYALLDDPDVNEAIDEAAAEADREASYKLWGELDEQIQKLAAAVTISHVKVNALAGKEIRGAFLNAQWSAVDVVSLGIAAG